MLNVKFYITTRDFIRKLTNSLNNAKVKHTENLPKWALLKLYTIILHFYCLLVSLFSLPADTAFPNNPVSSVWKEKGRPSQMCQSWYNHCLGYFPHFCTYTPLDTSCKKRSVKIWKNCQCNTMKECMKQH